MRRTLVTLFVVALVGFATASALGAGGANDVASYSWTKVYGDNPAGWAGRAGLQAVELRNRLYVMGGRTPNPTGGNPFGSTLWNDVWESRDNGASWAELATPAGSGMWAQRAYFQAVTKGGAMFVLGGQDFRVVGNPQYPNCPGSPPAPCPPVVPDSTFFNDVWRSTDGANWERLTDDAPWEGRAGLSAIVFKGWIYVLGGGRGDDVLIGGESRELLDDVWRSRDGRNWEPVTEHADWPARAGAAVVEKNGYLYLLGGEKGFNGAGCAGGQGPCDYFNDVWRSRDGASWEQVTGATGAGWSPRPGHQCQVLLDTIVCFGGFGWPTLANPGPPGPGNPFVAGHPVDVWTSRNGKDWDELTAPPWNATGSSEVKYDFDSLVVTGGPGGMRPSIFTFGGDREASFAAPDRSLVDDDVWRFSP